MSIWICQMIPSREYREPEATWSIQEGATGWHCGRRFVEVMLAFDEMHYLGFPTRPSRPADQRHGLPLIRRHLLGGGLAHHARAAAIDAHRRLAADGRAAYGPVLVERAMNAILRDIQVGVRRPNQIARPPSP